MMVEFVQCLVCGRMTPSDRGTCYHCGSPLPTKIRLPRGLIVCPNCLKITPVNTGYCTHCKSPLPPDLVEAALAAARSYVELRPTLFYVYNRRLVARGRVEGPGWGGYPYLPGDGNHSESMLNPLGLEGGASRPPRAFRVRRFRGDE